MTRKVDDEPARPMRADFFSHRESSRKKLLKTNRGSNPRTMLLTLVDHIQMDHYGARAAELYDTRDGELHGQVALIQGKAVITWSKASKAWRTEETE